MKKIIAGALCMGLIFIAWGADAYNGVWQRQTDKNIPFRGTRVIKPERSVVLSLDQQYLEAQLASLPQDPQRAIALELPVPDGSFRSFKVWQTPVMEPQLADKYPGLKTFTAYAVDDPRATAKIDITARGFHAMILDGDKTYFIDPYSNINDGFYSCYYKKDYLRPAGKYMECKTSAGHDEELAAGRLDLTDSGLPHMQFKINGTEKRTYRLALACTGEYAVAVAGPNPTKSDVLAAMVTSINRVNGVYEKEVALTMVLIANEDTLIFLDDATDPYSNSLPNPLLNENQATVDARIGTANYDIGHVFSTAGGGVANLGCVCSSGDKARGETGAADPTGDPFDIDYVAHEMGHQFGAQHPFNANTGSCNSNGVFSSAYEPGSGSTIMAYAGICGSQNNLQSNSDDYFHAISLSQISTFLNGSGGSCPVTALAGNTPPVLPLFSAVYYVPASTPFELTAPEAIDTDHDFLTYCWEQWNRGDFGKNWSQTFLKGPIYRSFSPDTSRTRVFIKMDSLLNNVTSYLGEKLPDTPRFLTFKLTVRDVLNGFGSFNFPDDTIHMNVINTGGPFRVLSPSTPVVWTGGSSQTITWDVAGTDLAPVSCANVDIFLSVDHGHTYPYILKANTPNDGSETIVLPVLQATGSARLKVKGAGNVFFNIGNSDFTINDPAGIAEVSWAGTVQVYPVPASDRITVSNDHGRDLALTMFNAIGQHVWKGGMKEQLSIPLGGMAKGIYYLQLKDPAGERIVKRIVVQ